MMTNTYDPHFPKCHNCGRTLPVHAPLGYCADCYRAYLRGRAAVIEERNASARVLGVEE